MPAGKRVALWALAIAPVMLLIGFFAVRAWLESYMRSEDFRRFVSSATARTLKAEGEFAPLQFAGMNSVYSDGFKARGSEEAAFSTVAVDQIRADLSLRRWSERIWQVDHVEAARVEVHLDGSRITLPQTTASTSSHLPTIGVSWLPNRVEIANASVRDVNLLWAGGGVRRVNVVANQRDGAWEIAGNGGRIEHGKLPGTEIVSARLLYREPTLFVQSAEFHQGASGTVSAEGEIRFGDQVDLRAKLADIDIAPFLNDDWRLRLHGKLSGDVRIEGAMPSSQPPVISGTLALNSGQIEALPVLNEIADFTMLQRYRRLTLSKASADFRQENGTLRATNFVLESVGLMRVEGAFTVKNGIIDGVFQVGVAASSLALVPGAQERVFTETRGGYVWTPMHLQGPIDGPGEDLSPRLMAAAKGAVIEKVESTVQGAIETGRDVIKGTLDRLMPLFK